jgi:hypothetical protein
MIDESKLYNSQQCFDVNDVCTACKLKRGADGYDPCLGHLTGAVSACCGHRGSHYGYICYEDGRTVVGDRVIRNKYGKVTFSKIVHRCVLTAKEVAQAKRENAQWGSH